MSLDLNRRAFIAGASVAAVGVTAPVLARQNVEETGFAQAISAFRAATEASSHFHEHVYKPAHEAKRQAVDAIPHFETSSVFEMGSGRSRPLTTAKEIDVRAAKGIARDCRPTDDPFNMACHELANAVEDRERQAEALDRQYRVSEYADRSDELGSVSAEALWAVEHYPITTIGDLIRKLEILKEQDIEEAQVETMLADLRRIAGRAS